MKVRKSLNSKQNYKCTEKSGTNFKNTKNVAVIKQILTNTCQSKSY